MKTWYVEVNDQRGTTLYHIGKYNYMNEAHEEALRGYGWYRVEPGKYNLVCE